MVILDCIIVVLYQFELYSWLYLLTGVFSLFFSIYLHAKKSVREVRCMSRLFLFISIWGIANFFEASATTIELKYLWSKISYFGIPAAPFVFFLFSVSFSGFTRLYKVRYIVLFGIIPVLAVLLAFTNEYHQLIWTDLTIDPVTNLGQYGHGIYYWIYVGYSYLLVLTGIFFLISALIKQNRFYAWQYALISLGAIFPLMGNVIYSFGINPIPGMDWTPVAFLLSGLFLTFGIIRLRLFDLVPFARERMVERMTFGYLVLEMDMRIRDSNPMVYDLLQIDPSNNLIGRKISDFRPEYEPFCSIMQDRLTGGKDIHEEFKAQEKWIEAWVSPLKDQNNKPGGVLVILTDISARKEAENQVKKYVAQLSRENEEKAKLIEELDSYAHTVAHDLKTPLGAVLNLSELIEEELASLDNHTVKTYLRMVIESAENMNHIVHELLLLATIRSEEVERHSINMEEIIRNVINRLRVPMDQNKIRVTFPEVWPSSLGYGPWIAEIWANYLSNAIKYGPSQSEIHLGYNQLENNFIKFWIEDLGTGVPGEKRDQLFKPFVRLSGKKVEGTGLGLSIIDRIITKLNGNCGVEENPQTGALSRFYFTLPADHTL